MSEDNNPLSLAQTALGLAVITAHLNWFLTLHAKYHRRIQQQLAARTHEVGNRESVQAALLKKAVGEACP